MEHVNEENSKPKTWGARLRSIGGAILDGLVHPSPYQVSLDPNYFRDMYGTAWPEGIEAGQRPLPEEQL